MSKTPYPGDDAQDDTRAEGYIIARVAVYARMLAHQDLRGAINVQDENGNEITVKIESIDNPPEHVFEAWRVSVQADGWSGEELLALSDRVEEGERALLTVVIP